MGRDAQRPSSRASVPSSFSPMTGGAGAAAARHGGRRVAPLDQLAQRSRRGEAPERRPTESDQRISAAATSSSSCSQRRWRRRVARASRAAHGRRSGPQPSVEGQAPGGDLAPVAAPRSRQRRSSRTPRRPGRAARCVGAVVTTSSQSRVRHHLVACSPRRRPASTSDAAL